MPKLIGITGHKGSGKDTAVARLEGFVQLRFADCLKAMIRTYLRYLALQETEIDKLLEDQEYKNRPSPFFLGKTPRHVMQTLGTEWGRNLIGGNIWVDATMANAAQHNNVVITDVRFLNEAKAVKDAGGILVKIKRPGNIGDGHESESYIDQMEVDYTIKNDSTIESLQQRMASIAILENLEVK